MHRTPYRCSKCGARGHNAATCTEWDQLINGRMRRHSSNCYVFQENAIGRRTYLAHPVGGNVAGNILRARAWLKFLTERNPGIAFSCQWLIEIEIWDDSNAKEREAGLVRCMNDIERCDDMIMCGVAVSSGMERERKHALSFDKQVQDNTGPNKEWPPGWGKV